MAKTIFFNFIIIYLKGNEIEDALKTKFSYDNGINWDNLNF